MSANIESESDMKWDRAKWKDRKSDHLSSCKTKSVESDDKHEIKNFTTQTKFQVSSAQAFKEILYKYESGGSLGIKQKSAQNLYNGIKKKKICVHPSRCPFEQEGKNVCCYKMVAGIKLGHIIKLY